MRRDGPNIDKIASRDGAATLTRTGYNSNRDVMGHTYLFDLQRDGLRAKTAAIVSSKTSMLAAAKAKSEGLPFWSWSAAERDVYVRKYVADNGRYYSIDSFSYGSDVFDQIIMITIRDKLLKLLADHVSSYRYNQQNYDPANDGCYDDVIDFSPYEIKREHYCQVRSRVIFACH